MRRARAASLAEAGRGEDSGAGEAAKSGETSIQAGVSGVSRDKGEGGVLPLPPVVWGAGGALAKLKAEAASNGLRHGP